MTNYIVNAALSPSTHWTPANALWISNMNFLICHEPYALFLPVRTISTSCFSTPEEPQSMSHTVHVFHNKKVLYLEKKVRVKMATYNVRSLHMFSMKYKIGKEQKKAGGPAL